MAFKNISLAENLHLVFPWITTLGGCWKLLKDRTLIFCPSCNETLNRKNVVGWWRESLKKSACENTSSLCFATKNKIINFKARYKISNVLRDNYINYH